MKTIDLLKQLISVPSFVDSQSNEANLCGFLEKYIGQNLPILKIERQYVDKKTNRFNLLINRQPNPTLLFVGHVDTVQPKAGWKTNPFVLTEKNKRLYGLGTSDMKGSIASLLTALQEVSIHLSKIMICLYVDEEYDFLGMKGLIKNFDINPQLIISLDGGLNLSSGCRGLIEVNFSVSGKSAHASKPYLGINAITQTGNIVKEFEEDIKKYKDEYLGISTMNLAYIRGGTIGIQNGNRVWQREGNIIPDFVDATVEVRTASKKLNAKKAISLIQKFAKKYKVKVGNFQIRHDIPLWPIAYKSKEVEKIKSAYRNANVLFEKSDRTFSGYIDVGMLSEVCNYPIFIIGAGGENQHGANEYTTLENLENAKKVYIELLKVYV